jgi:hypothetical protein
MDVKYYKKETMSGGKKKKGKNKDPNAQAMGRKGGRARAAALTGEERSAIAKKGADARWGRDKGGTKKRGRERRK